MCVCYILRHLITKLYQKIKSPIISVKTYTFPLKVSLLIHLPTVLWAEML